jgi:glycosyltransferase involved in cell wall biosynthesis
MKILFISNGYPTPNSPNLCPFIQSQVNDLRALNLKVDVISVSQFKKLGYFKTFFTTLSSIKSYDVVHLHHGLILLLCFPFYFLYPRKKFVISFLNNIEFEYEELKSKYLQIILIYFTKFVLRICNFTVIEKNKRFLRKFKQYYVLPNGVDLDFYKRQDRAEARLKLGLSDNAFIFLFVSSKNLYRNQKRIDRFEELISSNSKIFPLYMTGIDKVSTLDYYAASNFLVVTSELEGSPNAVKESIACGTSVLTLDVGDVRDILLGEDNSRVFSSFENMKNYVKSIDPTIYKTEFFDGHQILLKNGYNSNDIATKLLNIYKLKNESI